MTKQVLRVALLGAAALALAAGSAAAQQAPVKPWAPETPGWGPVPRVTVYCGDCGQVINDVA